MTKLQELVIKHNAINGGVKRLETCSNSSVELLAVRKHRNDVFSEIVKHLYVNYENFEITCDKNGNIEHITIDF